MPSFEFTSPEGKKYTVNGPDGATKEQAFQILQKQIGGASEPTVMQGIKQGAGNLAAGLIRGAGSIGATVLAPADMFNDWMAGKGLSLDSNRDRRALMDQFMRERGAEPDSLMYQGGKLGGEIAGTAGAGGAIANTARAVLPASAAANPLAAKLLESVASSGFRTGAPVANSLMGRAGDLGIRAIGGATAGGASAGLVSPQDAGLGAMIGGGLPVAAAGVGKTFQAAGKALRGGELSPEVKALAIRAKEMGIDIPADRLVNSRPLNAVASGLNYVPFSGRAATEAKMDRQLTQAATRLFGQDSDNMMLALRKASDDLGGKFDATLRNNVVNFDKQLLDDVTSVFNTAQKELGADSLKAIGGQIDELVAKGADGVIDGQAAYNIKRTLDRIGRRPTPEAFHALELKRALMGALDRSLGAEKAAAFATTRQQYGNMLSLEKLAKNGVEGEISVARLANMPNINNPALQEVADIAAQFVKAREGQHGAMQRAMAGLATASLGGPMGLAAGAAAGRGTNMLLNSSVTKNALTGQINPAVENALTEALKLTYKTAPTISAR